MKRNYLGSVLLFAAFIFTFIICYCFFQNSSRFQYHQDYLEHDVNDAYQGIGKTYVYGMDGYFSTFTSRDNNLKVYKEFKQNAGSWKNKSYWEGTMEDNGCGITALSIILSGYDKLETPDTLREKYAPVIKTNSISSELSETFGIKNSGLLYDNESLSQTKIINHLKSNRPILICVWSNNGKNIWTKKSHYMVLLAVQDDLVYVSNPNGLKKSGKDSGWYKLDQVIPFIASILYIESYR